LAIVLSLEMELALVLNPTGEASGASSYIAGYVVNLNYGAAFTPDWRQALHGTVDELHDIFGEQLKGVAPSS
jgi:hypothetical protein